MNNAEPLSTSQLTVLGLAFTGSLVGFTLLYEIIFRIYEHKSQTQNSESVCLLEYKRWTPQKKADFVSRITSQLHAFLAITLSVKALFFTCIEPNTNGDIDLEHGSYTNFFASDYCLMLHFNLWQMFSLAVTTGYLLFDIYICYARIQEKSKLQTQTYIHHVVGISGFISAIAYGRGGALIISNVLLVNELSTFFLNYRQFLLVFKKHESVWYKWNSIAFFFAFLLSRIVFNTIVAVWVARAFYLTIKDIPILEHPAWQIILGFYLIALFVIINILNLMWFRGILAHVKRNFTSHAASKHGDYQRQEDSNSAAEMPIEPEKKEEKGGPKNNYNSTGEQPERVGEVGVKLRKKTEQAAAAGPSERE